MKHYADIYRRELLESVIPFWVRHSRDEQGGGFFTCLDRTGQVFDTDKFVWLQGRQVWTFATLCDQVEARDEWRAMALHGADFLQRYGRDQSGQWYFALDRGGRPLVQPHSIFSDCFAAMAFGALYKIQPDESYAQIARDTFAQILARRHNPKGPYNKTFPGTRPLRGFALPMILCNLALELAHLLEAAEVDALVSEVLYEVMEVFCHDDSGLMLENVAADGQFSDTFEGRLTNPGHALEAMWFVMDLGVRRQDAALIGRAVDTALRTLEYGWDARHGGIFYFLDLLGKPPQQLEWDQKLWWVHLEALVCMAKAHQLTGRPETAEWFGRLHEYTWRRFPDPEHGEWYGYLNRQGEVLLPLKGGKWKGCFHVPRALWQVGQTLAAGATTQAFGPSPLPAPTSPPTARPMSK